MGLLGFYGTSPPRISGLLPALQLFLLSSFHNIWVWPKICVTQIVVHKLLLSQNSCLSCCAGLNVHRWTDSPFKDHKSIFLLEELWILLKSSFFKVCTSVYMGKIKSYFQGRTSKFKVLKPYFSTRELTLLPILSHPSLSCTHTHFKKGLQTPSVCYKSYGYLSSSPASP